MKLPSGEASQLVRRENPDGWSSAEKHANPQNALSRWKVSTTIMLALVGPLARLQEFAKSDASYSRSAGKAERKERTETYLGNALAYPLQLEDQSRRPSQGLAWVTQVRSLRRGRLQTLNGDGHVSAILS